MHRNEEGLSFFGFLELRDAEAISHVKLKATRYSSIFKNLSVPLNLKITQVSNSI